MKTSKKKERLFFHDIINHTHGVLLFLNQKEQAHECLDLHEVKSLAAEIKTLQSLIKDHYGIDQKNKLQNGHAHFHHKNLTQTHEWVVFSDAISTVKQLMQTYFSDKKEMEMSVVIKSEAQESYFIYYPTFYRIMNNLIKNISESHSKKMEFLLEIKNEGVFIHTVNEIPAENAREVLDYFSKEKTVHHLGLESIKHLARDLGGTFQYEIKGQQWINNLHLPLRKSSQERESQKMPA